MSIPDGFPPNWQIQLHEFVRDAADGFWDERTDHGDAAVHLVSYWLGVPHTPQRTSYADPEPS